MPPEDADFAFTIDFEKGAGDPRRVFDAASTLVDAFERLDEALLPSIDQKIKTVMVLEDVEAGSLRVWLKNILDRVPDEALRDFEWKKAVGHYLIKAKYLALRFCDDETAGRPALDKLREELRELARATDARHLPDYAPVHEGRLVSSLDQIQNAKSRLGPNDKLIVQTDEQTYEVDLSKTSLPSDFVVPADTNETQSEGEVILTVRKPDLLGSAMWQFAHGKSTLSAAVHDQLWLDDFHARKIPLLPGDALRCQVKFTYVYDERGMLIEQKTEIMKVIEVINGPPSQGRLL